ncbi:MAG: pyocin knob domain-containing protein [Aminipila sp.]
MNTYKSKYTGEEVDASVGMRTIVSETAPTNRTSGNVGQFLFDSVTGIIYQCKAVALDTDSTKLYTWKNIMENVGAGDMAKSVYDPTNKARDIFKDIGDLTVLETTEKGSTVGAINEVNANLNEITHRGYISSVVTLTDFNLAISNGKYVLFGGSLHAPFEATSYAITLDVTAQTADTLTQTAKVLWGTNVGKIYTRTVASNVWTNWQEIATTNQFCNPNMLDNPWFGKGVINQRGLNTYCSSYPAFSYGIDRWKCTDTTVNVMTNDINIVSTQTATYKRFTQMTELTLYANISYTLSIYLSGTTSGSVQLRPCNSTYGSIGFSKLIPSSTTKQLITLTFTPTTDILNFGVEILALNTINDYFDLTIQQAKLELGSISTLHLDSPPNLQVELAKCQRHQLVLGKSSINTVIGVAIAQSTTSAIGIIATPSTLRCTSPSLSVSDIKGLKLSNGATVFAMTALTSFGGAGNSAYLLLTSTGLTVGTTYLIRLEAASFIIDANI